ncbi:hypothetical protein RFI_21304 [Reticulomyxa filosa]|uniref:Uncharacterized protein n=1 Tax=Reticulomyxa filosa TaxID=46433 RepID=X6MQX1_RETFI|nr:hypothetical protein RFI_21304 [Reticulomyxa filosa]|eukprot:ETO16056.1 hypothetical protein RFI_21304 [Reticulomyxa filosa]
MAEQEDLLPALLSSYFVEIVIKQTSETEKGTEWLKFGQPLEGFSFVLYGILQYLGFSSITNASISEKKEEDEKEKDSEKKQSTEKSANWPWRISNPLVPFIAYNMVHLAKYPPPCRFHIKCVSMGPQLFAVHIQCSLIHPLTFVSLTTTYHLTFKCNVAVINRTNPFCSLEESELLMSIYKIVRDKFYALWEKHEQSIRSLSKDEEAIYSQYTRVVSSSLLPPFRILSENKELKDKQPPFSLFQLKHMHMALLCHLILRHCQFQEIGIDTESAANNNTQPNIDLVCANITNAIKFDRSFNISYQVPLMTRSISNDQLANSTQSRQESKEIDTKRIRVRYTPMLDCALLIVEDNTLAVARITRPRVTL